LTMTQFYTDTHDYGVVGPGTIGDYVWFDQNRNGLQDAGEMPIAGAVVSLTFGNSLFTATTNASGYYSFTHLLLNKTYTTTIQMGSLPPQSDLTTPNHFS
jgi:hypothetical protein